MKRLAQVLGLAAMLVFSSAATAAPKSTSDTKSTRTLKKKTAKKTAAKSQKKSVSRGKALDRKLMQLGERSIWTSSFGTF